ncbi:MAG: Fe-S oxidoreductase [Betaproteobacteria bacterium HGW-Betaproteobacteria-14]|nr:MAG: Fe-S oxidoreductase [Betaproteobacteria bacterium HGW-Betaproteobacteria-14]
MKVGLFVTCLVDLMRPRIGFAALRLLQAAGCEVVVPTTQTCCGQPAYNSGDRRAARLLAEKLIAEFESCDHVVAPSGSCAGMIRMHYPDLFADDPAWLERAAALGARTHELSDFLATVARLDKVPGAFAGTVTYHDACSGLRELGVKAQPRALLAKMPGVRLVEMDGAEECCGFGGAFAVKFGDISARLAEKKCDNLRASGADAVVLSDLGCMLSIEGKLRRMGDEKTRVLHIAEILSGEA